jgi:5-methyltetrahydrofolate--homocysteine methyltransferase
MGNLKDIENAVVSGEIDETKNRVSQALDQGISPMEIIEKGLVSGLDIVGEHFATGEAFLPEMMVSAVAAREGMVIATASMGKNQPKPKAKMILGTVKEDVHDIGKNLVALVLRGRGFEVVDLGVNVHEEQFIDAVREHKPEFVGISCMLTTTMMGMKDVINALNESGLRNNSKIIVGGAPVSQEFAFQIGADYFARDAGSAAALLEKIIGKPVL